MNDNDSTGKDMGVITGGSKHVSKKPWLKIIVILAVLVLAGLGAWWFIHKDGGYLDISRLDSKNDRIAQAQALAGKPLPKVALDKAAYYAEIGANLRSAKEYTYAEHYFLTAQKTANENHVDGKEARYYVALADIYKMMGNDEKFKEYTDKENKFLQDNYSKEQLDEMKGATLDEPRKD